MKTMLELFLLTYLIAAVSGVLVGSVSAPLVMSRSTMFGLTMLHSILGGAVLGVYLNIVFGLGIPIPLAATISAILLSIMTAELVEKGFAEDAAIALSVAVATTITIVFSYLASYVSSTAIAEAWAYVTGTSAIATIDDLLKVVVAAVIVAPIMLLIFREFKYISFDEDGAKTLGLNVRLYRYVFYALTAITASTLSATIGVLITHVALAVPGAVAMRLSRKSHLTISFIVALALMLVGYFLARMINIPPSGGVGILSALMIVVIVLGHGKG